MRLLNTLFTAFSLVLGAWAVPALAAGPTAPAGDIVLQLSGRIAKENSASGAAFDVVK